MQGKEAGRKILMFKTCPSTSPVSVRFFQPVADLFAKLGSRRSCPALSDIEFIELGVCRVLSQASSGRDFLQAHHEAGGPNPSVGLFFETLKSTRRLSLCREVNRSLEKSLGAVGEDPFLAFPELGDFDLYAGDGHYHAAAVHDPALGGSRRAVGHFFMLNLRSRALHHLALGQSGGERKCEHDMHVLKRLDFVALRHGAKKGRKVMLVWDRAGIDFRLWYKAKQVGLYFLSREKENMRLETMGILPFDKNDPRNRGVQSDELVGTSQGVFVRRITYHDPVEKITYAYLTSNHTLPPGLLVVLYKRRWDIEKVFDETKNKFQEAKAWASSPQAKMIQGQFIAMTHNLMLFIEADLDQREHVRNEPEIARREKRLQQVANRLAKDGHPLPFAYSAFRQLTQRGVKLIRWLRNHLFNHCPWPAAVSHLRHLYAAL